MNRDRMNRTPPQNRDLLRSRHERRGHMMFVSKVITGGSAPTVRLQCSWCQMEAEFSVGDAVPNFHDSLCGIHAFGGKQLEESREFQDRIIAAALARLDQIDALRKEVQDIRDALQAKRVGQ